MNCFSLSCFSNSSAKIKTSDQENSSKKQDICCYYCKAKKNIMTLECSHKCCVKCFNKGRFYCRECENLKSSWRSF